jgi:hypothetical protein
MTVLNAKRVNDILYARTGSGNGRFTRSDIERINKRETLEFRVPAISARKALVVLNKLGRMSSYVTVTASCFQYTVHPDVGTPMSAAGSAIREANRGWSGDAWEWVDAQTLKKKLRYFNGQFFVYFRFAVEKSPMRIENTHPTGGRREVQFIPGVVDPKGTKARVKVLEVFLKMGLHPIHDRAPMNKYLDEIGGYRSMG